MPTSCTSPPAPSRILPDNSGDPMGEIFGADGALALKLPGFEPRQGQLAMAAAVAAILSAGHGSDPYQPGPAAMLAVEAGTGIGKTLAYLIPAALSGQKVIVSTGTLNLQEQILTRDIPFIIRHIDPTLSALCVKGRQNYLCLRRWQQFITRPQASLFIDDHDRDKIIRWLADTETGDRAELNWLPDASPLWQQISSSTSQCLGMHCPESASCFVNQLRKRAARSRLLIVNHHLFFSDLALRRFGNAEVLPRYESVIFDEAHHLEDVATTYFGTSFSHYQVLDLAQDAEKAAAQELNGKQGQKIIQLARALLSQADRFLHIFPKDRGRFPLLDFIDASPSWAEEYQALSACLTALARELDALAPAGETWPALSRRTEELLIKLRIITEEQDSSHVYWYERREKTLALAATPIAIDHELQDSLYCQVRSIVFTSATLTTGGDFGYFLDRLGLPRETDTLSLPTPFDYAERTLLYIPDKGFPEPTSPLFQPKVQEELLEIITASGGRALLLFTSISAMRNAYSFLADRLTVPLLMQGRAPKQALLDEFTRDKASVLLAVASFWEGVDVPGESLSCVIIDKLPFEVPSDPVIMARINKIKEEGGNPFWDLQIPRAILALRQGVGRLMRASSDRGLLAIMDIRLFTKQYGRRFLNSLPDSPLTRSMAAVRLFFQQGE